VDVVSTSGQKKNLADIIAINAEGDLFGTSLRHADPAHDLPFDMDEEEEEETREREERVDGLLQNWGSQVMEAAQLKMFPARALFAIPRLPTTEAFVESRVKAAEKKKGLR